MLRQEAGIQIDKFYPPTDWQDSNNKQIDIRKNAENNSIVLLVGHSADFSKYSLLGLLVDTSSGTYDVYIDDVLVGSGITKSTQYDIDFSTINTSYGSATTPEALVLHKVVIKPTTSGEKITVFGCRRTNGVTSLQTQGVIWCHLELVNNINMSSFNYINRYSQIMYALTTKGNVLHLLYGSNVFPDMFYIQYMPIIDFNNRSLTEMYNLVRGTQNLKRLKISSLNAENISCNDLFYGNNSIEQIAVKNVKINLASNTYTSNSKLKIIPQTKGTKEIISSFGVSELYPTKIDTSDNDTTTRVFFSSGTSTQMRGLRGLKVSNEAPFTGTSPQINVAYTGLDRDALVELFQSLPTVTGGQTLSLVRATGNNIDIVGSPTIDENGVVSGFSSSNYLRLGQSTINFNNDFEMQVEFTKTATGSCGLMVGSTYTYGGLMYSNNKINFAIRLGDGTANTYQLFSNNSVELNTLYRANVKRTGNKIVLKIYKNGILDEEVKDDLTNISFTTNIGYMVFGFRAGGEVLNGNIYLENCLLKHKQNYLMKGYLLDTDKAIATDKGWGLVLS